MIPLLAKNAVKLKCTYDDAGLTGNYECAYALGVLAADSGLGNVNSIESFSKLKIEICGQIKNYKSDEPLMKRLCELVKDYEATDADDEQLLELFHMGYEDKIIK